MDGTLTRQGPIANDGKLIFNRHLPKNSEIASNVSMFLDVTVVECTGPVVSTGNCTLNHPFNSSRTRARSRNLFRTITCPPLRSGD